MRSADFRKRLASLVYQIALLVIEAGDFGAARELMDLALKIENWVSMK